MKKRLFLALFIIYAFFLPESLFAQTISPVKDTLLPLKQSSPPAGLVVAPKLIRVIEAISNNLKNRAERLSNIAIRIAGRISKMKEMGLEVVSLEKSSENISTQIQKLSSDLAQLEKLGEAVNKEGAKKSDLNAWRKQATVVRQDILNVLKLQKNLVSEMKKLVTKPTLPE